jgi:hypothetical protein
MRLVLSFMIASLGLIASSANLSADMFSGVRRSDLESNTAIATGPLCLSDGDISSALQTLSSARTYSEQEKSLASLRASAKTSTLCRKQVIQALIAAMDKPRIDLITDRPTFYLWHYGTGLLSDLKAVESLDFLIAHFDVDDGTRFPLNHHPALVSVINMGEIAVPKLESVLKQSSDSLPKRYAVFCLAQIGGPFAKRVLQQDLDSVSDECVSNFIKASLGAFNNKLLPNHITSKDRTKWYSTFLCEAGKGGEQL